ncbi:MAG: acyltransferase family protein [Oscillospiraceae bacterium]|nr:acyltransferase family protein [Oscillospiraceae bacterium]
MQTAGKNRDAAVDFSKATAIIGVVLIHACSDALTAPLFSHSWLCAVVLRTLAAASVPLFFLCSGALMLDPNKDLPLRRLYTKNLPRIILALFAWAVFYKLLDLATDGTLSWQTIRQAGKELLLFRHKYHLYFLQIMVVVYAFLPITRVFVRHASQKELRYFIGLWLLLGIVYPTVAGWKPFRLLSGTPRQWMINQTYAAIGYGVLGHYLKTNAAAFQKSGLAVAGGLLIVLFGTILMSVRRHALYAGFWEGMSIGAALMAAGFFTLSIRHPSWGKSAFVLQLSKASFCIYLVHVAILPFCQKLGASVLLVPVITAATIAISYGIFCLLSRIPIIRTWII